MTTKSLFDQYSQHLKDAEIPALGYLAWYHVPDSSQIVHKDFLKLVETSDAPIKTPNVPKAADVFRRACNNAKMLKVRSDHNTYYNYTMRDAGYDEGFVFRRMVEEELDNKNHKLGFRVLGLVTFAKKGVSAAYSREIDADDPAVAYWDAMKGKVDEFLSTKMLHLPAIAVREATRKGLEIHLLGTRVRPSGGVYFVGMDKGDKLEALDYVINHVPESSFHILPLVDDARQREMLKQAFEDESIEETTRMVGEITDLLKSDSNIPAPTFLAYQERYNFQKRKLKEYSNLLSDALDRSQNALDICNKQIVALLDKASD
jgi:hypothetical protein